MLQHGPPSQEITYSHHHLYDYPKRDDEKFMQHTLAWCDGKNSKISYREVHKSTLTNEVQYFPPQERVY